MSPHRIHRPSSQLIVPSHLRPPHGWSHAAAAPSLLSPAPGYNTWWSTDTDRHPGAVHLTGGNVDTIDDLSGNGNTALQATAGNMPPWSASGTGGLIQLSSPRWMGNNAKTPVLGNLYVLANWTGGLAFTSVNGLFTCYDQTPTTLVHLAGMSPTNSLFNTEWRATMLPYKDGNAVSNRFFDVMGDWHIWELQDTAPVNMVVGYRLGVLRDQGIYWVGNFAGLLMYPSILGAADRLQTCEYLRELATRLTVVPPA